MTKLLFFVGYTYATVGFLMLVLGWLVAAERERLRQSIIKSRDAIAADLRTIRPWPISKFLKIVAKTVLSVIALLGLLFILIRPLAAMLIGFAILLYLSI